MPTYTQAGRLLELATPLGENKLLLVGLAGQEHVSQLFSFQLDALAEGSAEIAFDRLLGQPVGVSLGLPDGKTRHFHGIVRRAAQGTRAAPDGSGTVFTEYRLEVVPSLWLLTRRAQSRIFQSLTVPDILKKVLAGLDVSYELQGTYDPRNYCVQYRETDFHFASRLMEEEGIFYFFKHTAGGHQMVVADHAGAHPDVPEEPAVTYDEGAGGYTADDRVRQWEKSQELAPGKFTLWDHHFELPGKHLEVEKPIVASVQAGTVSHQVKMAVNESLEVYDYPGAYAQRYDGVDRGGGEAASALQKVFQDNKRTVELRMQQHAAGSLTVRGAGGCRQFTAGHKFALGGHFDADGPYVLTSVTHEVSGDGYRSGGEAGSYANTFTCIPLALPYRPPATTRKPRVEGCQTAVVVGPEGDEIFTDKYGRVKVQMHWDREGKSDAQSSCWLRVATAWAGRQWGAVHIPRVGQEVVVDFLEGDPDRPIVIGSVYNAEQMPPYTLPDNKSQSGLKTRSTPKGTAETFNELRFEDRKGEEQVYLHAEKNLDTVVENDETHRVGFEKKDKGDQKIEVYNNQTVMVGAGKGEATDGSQTTEVFNNQTVKVGDAAASGASQTVTVYKDQTVTVETGNQKVQVKTGNREVLVDTGDDTLRVKTGNRGVQVDVGDDTLQVKVGNRAVQVDMGNDTLTVKTGNVVTKASLGKIEEEAMQSIEMKVGANSIKIDQTGVTIKGMMVKIEGQVQTEVKGLMATVSGDAMLTVKGGITMIN